MGSSSSAKQEVADYYLSLHIGVCQEADAVTGLFYGEKLMWEGEQAEEGKILISKKSLFGGPKKEGGVAGSVLVFPGSETQVLPADMTERWGVGDPSQTPAYRGMMSLFFCGYTPAFEPDPDPGPDPDIEWGGPASKEPTVGFFDSPPSPEYLHTTQEQSLYVGELDSPDVWGDRYYWWECSVDGEYLVEDGVAYDGWGKRWYKNFAPRCSITNPCRVWFHEGTEEHACGYCLPGWVDAGPEAVEAGQPRCQYPDLTDDSTFSGTNGRKGFLWSSNTPYLRDIWVRVRRSPKGAASAIGDPMIGDDANPAAILFEVFNSPRFGMGVPAEQIDSDSFAYASALLVDEGLGLSMVMSNPSEADEFVNSVLDHIDGLTFAHPRTGKHTLKLIRGDYDVDDLPEVTPKNAKMVSFQRRGWGETANEITTTWTNPETEQEETVTLQDLGNITQQQGAVIADSRNYYGVRSSELAMSLCARELRKAAYPTASCEVKILREGWDIVPGGVVKLVWPDYGADGVVMRVSEIDYGERTSPWITLRMVEDIFSLPLTSYTAPPSSGWVDTSEDPAPLDYTHLFTLPAYFEAMLNGIPVSSLVYPEASVGVLGATNQSDAFGFDLMELVTLPSGGKAWDDTGGKGLMGHGFLANDVSAEAYTELPDFTDLIGDYQPVASVFVMFVGPSDSRDDHELCLVEYDEAGDLRLARGVLDTIPKTWPVGTTTWFIPPTAEIVAEQRQVLGTAPFRLLTATSKGLLAKEDAPYETTIVDVRAHRPNRPANVVIGGVEFGTLVSADGLDIEVTWARRNRLNEEGAVLSWTDGDMTPEAGQLTYIEVLDRTGSRLQIFSDLAGTSYTVPLSAFGSEVFGRIEVGSRRVIDDGEGGSLPITSLMAHGVDVEIVPVDAFATESGEYVTTESGDGDYLTEE